MQQREIFFFCSLNKNKQMKTIDNYKKHLLQNGSVMGENQLIMFHGAGV